jgi:hypothetical protein
MTKKNTKPFAKTADADLFKLHDKFCAAYQKMKELDVGAVEKGTKEQRARYRKWERSISVATDRGRDVIVAPAFTLEGMLMKLHVMGFVIDDTKPGTFSVPYCSGIRPWQVGGICEDDDNLALIVSLRDDLHRLMGRRI